MNNNDIIARARLDPLWYIETYLKITRKDSSVGPLILNMPQREWFYKSLQNQMLRQGKIRQVWLKARQMGASTIRAADMFHSTVFNPNTMSYIISHDNESAGVIFSMSELFYQMLPAFLKPAIRRSNRRELYFAAPMKSGGSPGLRSRFVISVAKGAKESMARSANVRHVHGSEVAYWGKDAGESMVAIEQSVPDLTGTSIVYESTAYEAGGAFYDRYDSAKKGKSDWVALFVPWFADPTYATALDPEERLVLDGEEHRMIELFGLSLPQIKWRRSKIMNECQGKVAFFRREYPSTDEEAFMYIKNRNVFNTEILVSLRKRAEDQKPVWQGNVLHNRLRDDPAGKLKIWRQPAQGRRYIVAVDPAEGYFEGCNQTIEVLDVVTLEQVAEWADTVPILELARVSVIVAEHFNRCRLTIESNNHGLAVIKAVENLGYGNVYQREITDVPGMPPEKRTGWLTTMKNKPLIEDLLDSMIMEGGLIIRSPELIQELITYVRKDDGSTGAPTGKFADRAMAYMIGLYIAYHSGQHGRHLKDFFDDSKPKPVIVVNSLADIREQSRLFKQQQTIQNNTSTRQVAPLLFRR